jgi:hypothetical protein
LTQELQWHKLIPIDQHSRFLCAERAYCSEEEKAFYEACEHNIEERRQVVLKKREEYLLYYLEHELV